MIPMKKEVVFAIALGAIVGLVITFGIYTANKALQQRREETTTTQVQDTKGSSENEPSAMRIYAPEDGSLVDKDTLQISGVTFPNATLAIYVNDALYIATADAKGNFSAELKLDAGSNVITSIATAPDGTQERDARLVVFSTANLDDGTTATNSAKPKATPTPTPKPGSTQ